MFAFGWKCIFVVSWYAIFQDHVSPIIMKETLESLRYWIYLLFVALHKKDLIWCACFICQSNDYITGMQKAPLLYYALYIQICNIYIIYICLRIVFFRICRQEGATLTTRSLRLLQLDPSDLDTFIQVQKSAPLKRQVCVSTFRRKVVHFISTSSLND